jgi:hypothetical protein
MEQKEIAKKMLPVIKAIADGKTIQFHNGKEWVTETGVNLKEICNDIIANLAEYRIKPDDEFKPKNKITETQKQYRPFKDCDEMIEYYQEKYKFAIGCDVYFPSLYKPSIWIKSKVYKTEHLITGYDNDTKGLRYGSCVYTSIYKWIDMKELFDSFTFLDGSPCGCWR